MLVGPSDDIIESKIVTGPNLKLPRGASCPLSPMLATPLSGEALANRSLSFLKQHLALMKVRGQAYDGAGNMSGKRNGAAALSSLLLCTYTVPLIALLQLAEFRK